MGGIPSGADPTGWDASTGTDPHKGWDATALPGAVVGGQSVDGTIMGAGLSNLAQRTQAAVTAAYQQVVQNNHTMKSWSDQVFKDLAAHLGLSGALVNSIGQSLGAVQDTNGTVAQWLSSIQTWSTTFNAALAAATTDATNAGVAFSNFLAELGRGNSNAAASWLNLINTNLQSTWNDLVYAFTGVNPASASHTDVKNAASAVTAIANTASTNATSAQTSANIAHAKILLLATTPNMVLDPKFDQPLMWTNAGGVQTTMQSHSGSYAWQLVGQG